MADIATIKADPKFQALPPASQEAILARASGTLPPEQGGGAGGSVTASPTPWSQSVREAVPGIPGQIAGAATEAVADPVQRIYQGGVHGAKTMPGRTASDALQTVANVATVPLAAAGAPEALVGLGVTAGVQGLAEAAGLSPNTAKLLGAAGGLFGSAGSARVRTFRAGRAGKAIAHEADLMRQPAVAVKGAPQATATENSGEFFQRAVRTRLAQNGTRLGRDIAANESAIAAAAPELNPGANMRITKEVTTLTDRGFQPTGLGENAQNAWDRIQASVANGVPIRTADAVTLRRELQPVLQRQYTPGMQHDPQLAFQRRFRVALGDAIETSAPGQMGAKYAASRDAYLNDVARPQRILRHVMSDNTSPGQAYGKVFGLISSGSVDDTRVLRTVFDTLDARHRPDVFAKLRMGVIERLAEVTNDFKDGNATRMAFDQQRGALAATGLFDQQELSRLAFWIKRNELPALVQKVADSASRHQFVAGGVALGVMPAIAALAATNPIGLTAALLAGGGMRTMIRLSHLENGSVGVAGMGADIVRRISSVATGLNRSQHKGTSEDDPQVDH